VTRRTGALVTVFLGAATMAAVAACDGNTTTSSSSAGSAASRSGSASHAHRSTVRHPRGTIAAGAPKRAAPSYPRLLPAATGSLPTNFVPAVRWRGQNAAWVARRPGFALLSFNQQLVELRMHSGTIDAGSTGWRYGPTIAAPERRLLVAAFNGGFKFETHSGGFESYGRIGAPLSDGLGSIVTYSDGTTNIGAWHQGVPAPGKRVASVRQNLRLLMDGGRPAADTGCLLCWGATLGGVTDPARSALGITADGHLVWAGGERLTVAELVDVLAGARVVRAVELDINPEWVAGYLYGHRGGVGPLAAVPVVPGQPGVPGQFLAPYSRDFFTIVAR
jgi:hypothetical protein